MSLITQMSSCFIKEFIESLEHDLTAQTLDDVAYRKLVIQISCNTSEFIEFLMWWQFLVGLLANFIIFIQDKILNRTATQQEFFYLSI